jgi:hypothetical protein
LISLLLVSAEDEPVNPEFVCGDGSDSFAIGDSVPICVHFKVDGASDNRLKSVFEPAVDKYSAIMVSGAFLEYKGFSSVQIAL